MKHKKKIIFAIILLIFAVIWNIPQPSHEGNWKIPYQKLPIAKISGDLLEIQNIRDFTYRSTEDFDQNYITDIFDITKLEKIYFIVSHFTEFEGIAHTMLSFHFSDGKKLTISIEARQEIGESYSPLLGALKNYEIIYIAATEEDSLRLRTEIRNEKVYKYPVQTEPEKAQKLLKSFISRMQKIEKNPEFYNTFWNNCTNQILHHIREIATKKIPLTITTILPGYSDEYAYDMQFIPHDLSLEKIREKYRVDDKEVKSSGNLSQNIRELLEEEN